MAPHDFEPVATDPELLRTLVDRVSAMMAYWDANERCRFANRAYERWFGVRPESLIGKSLRDLLGPIYPLNRPYIEGALRGEPQEFEREIPDPAGGLPRHSLAQYLPDVVDGVVRGFFVMVSDVTQIKRAQLALQRSEAKLGSIIETSPDAIISIDEQQRIVLFNGGAEDIFGWSRDEALGKPLELLIPERFRERHREHVRAFAGGAVASQRMKNGNLCGLRKSGQEFPAEASIFKVEVGGAPVLSVSLRDVSEAKRTVREREDLLVRETRAREQAEAANAELRESEERFRLIIDDAPIGMGLVALDYRFVRVNRALCEILGYTSEELTRLTSRGLTHPEDVETDVALVASLLRGEIPRYQRAKRYFRKDGTLVDAMLSVSLLRGPDGAPHYFIGQLEDISERMRIEREQRFLAEIGPILASTLAYDELLTKLADVAVKDLADLCIVDVVEDGKLRRARVTSRDPRKEPVCKLLAGISLDAGRPYLLRSVIETREPLLLERPSAEQIASFAQSDDHLRALRGAEIRSVVAAPLIARGELLGAIGLISSSDSRAYGAYELRMARELALRAALSLDNARLYRAANRATQARDDVLAIVAHDLRNPLNAILLHARLLEREGGGPGSPSATPGAQIERSARRMNRLIQDLLDVSRMEAGALPIMQERVSSEQLVADSLETQKALAAAASVELASNVASPLPSVWGDRDRLLQVFENLIGNALKFTKAGGRVTLTATRQGGEVLFSVADTGRGIDAEELPHVFDRFWQGRSQQHHGAGLGLPIVKGIVEAHHGRIWVESVREHGTTFSFTLPMAPEGQLRRSAAA